MPVPIRTNRDNQQDNNKLALDYSFLLNQMEPIQSAIKKTVVASNKDADVLFNIWTKCDKMQDNETFKLSPSLGISSQDVMRLKSMGLVTGSANEGVKITSRGKIIITTLVLGEPNAFAKNAERKNYSEILASMDKKGKKGYRLPKYAADTTNFLRLG